MAQSASSLCPNAKRIHSVVENSQAKWKEYVDHAVNGSSTSTRAINFEDLISRVPAISDGRPLKRLGKSCYGYATWVSL